MSDVTVPVYRAPMRSRSDDVDVAATIERARARGVCGFGERGTSADQLARRIERFREVAGGSFVWTRDPDGLYWLGRITGPYFYDNDEQAVTVDLVHVRECRWLTTPLLEADIPAAVAATYARGGRNFQQTHDKAVGEETMRIWRTFT